MSLRQARLEDELLEEIEPPKVRHFEQVITRKVQHFYISSIVAEPFYYVDMIHRIHSAGPEDIIYIHLNTPGGHLDTGMQIVNAMRSTPAHVIASIESEAHSLGTLIFLAADEFIVHDHVMMMFHSYSGGIFGKGHEQTAQLQGTTKWFTNVARKLYIPFLEEQELERILRGEDLYIHSEEIRRRLERIVRDRQEKRDLPPPPAKVTTSKRKPKKKTET